MKNQKLIIGLVAVAGAYLLWKKPWEKEEPTGSSNAGGCELSNCDCQGMGILEDCVYMAGVGCVAVCGTSEGRKHVYPMKYRARR